MLMYIPLGIKTDYSILQSLIKIPDIISYAKEHSLKYLGILDDNLYSSISFYDTCLKNNIIPIIGLKIELSSNFIYLYAEDYLGYLNLLKINTLVEKQELNYQNLKTYKENIICVIPYKYHEIYNELSFFSKLYISYTNEYEYKSSSIITTNLVYIEETRAINFNDIRYLSILKEIDTGKKIPYDEYIDSYLEKEVPELFTKSTIEFSKLFHLEIPKNKKYIPHYDNSIKDSFIYLKSLCKKGLEKRLNNKITKDYLDRLTMELNVIEKMGFIDYFLIVYDYVKYAKQHNILVGPGRGSAAGSLVSYCLGITNIDPLKYNLLFERFLNPERVTMPDIDIDFEYTKRDQVISYVKKRYGENNVANIMTFNTLGSRQVIRDVSKCFEIDQTTIDKLSNLINPKLSLSENYQNKYILEYLNKNKKLKQVYQICYKLEGLKRHISTHAAGVVISSIPLDDVIPICYNSGELLTGCTMEYLEELGLLKMDFLALKNLTIIQNVLDLIEEETKERINLSTIPLNDTKTMQVFKDVDTEGIFQFESSGMKNFLAKLNPDNFNDLISAIALFRPGPMNNIDTYIKRKNKEEKIIYPDDSLSDILKDTYGIIIYQEQIMQILVKMGNYSYAEADNIRRAMSKKKKEVMEKERNIFISRSIKNGYNNHTAEEVYDLIIKFADYGFNKAHSVSYALIGYQMAYLKANYPIYFIANLLNMSIGSDIKTKEYLDEAKKKNIYIIKPDINLSTNNYLIKDNTLLLPLNTIHNIGNNTLEVILKERKEHGKYQDFFDFVARTYGVGVNKKTIESLIDGDTFREFKTNHQTLYSNIDAALDYASLCKDLDESLVMKPNLVIKEEFKEKYLMEQELNCFGFYVTNHPASKYQKDIVKIKDIKKYFDKYINLVVIIGNIRKIKTKKGDDMAFLEGSDETSKIEFIIFPKNNKYLSEINKNDLVKIRGQVTRRVNEYQIIVSTLEKIS